jgi:arginase family enzyme
MAPARAAVLIGAPTDIGASDRGASMGPEALRVAGLAEALRNQIRGCRPPKAIDTSRRSPTGIG